MKNIKTLILASSTLPFIAPAYADQSLASIQSLLDSIAADPIAFARKDMPSAKKLARITAAKRQFRNKVIRSSTYTGGQGNDNPEQLVDRLQYRSIQAMDNAHLKSAELAMQPWSSSYWPIYKGGLANRYADPNYFATMNWQENADYLTTNFGVGPRDELSPAEKYDILVGDKNFSLSKAMLAQGQFYYIAKDHVETWMGICHGWAPASYMVPRPAESIEVVSADGSKLTFRPTDIKALVSLLWAEGITKMKSAGGRCEQAQPSEDRLGRAVNLNCLDSNPATWHLSLVNQIGVAKRGLIMDAVASAEVWNQPIFSYQYTFFNPKTMKAAATLEEAQVNISDFTADRFKLIRDRAAKTIIGIVMEVSYGMETEPSLAATDSISNDMLTTKSYTYDLELDSENNIIGGEWYQNNHPDFLWTPVAGSSALSTGDEYLRRTRNKEVWLKNTPVPMSWRQAAIATAPYRQPLAKIVERLVARMN